MCVKTPRFVTHSPQFHHQKTTIFTRFSLKPPVKTPIHQPEKIYKRRKAGIAPGLCFESMLVMR
jgi:hypothetical protein